MIQKIIFFIATSLLIIACYIDSCEAQDTLTVKGISITKDDSLKARKLLNRTIQPTSELWAEKAKEQGHYNASNLFIGLASVAYPKDSPRFRTAYVDSIQQYMVEVGKNHPNEDVRAEFLKKALSLSQTLGKEDQKNKLYEALTTEYTENYYAQDLDVFAPDRNIKVGKQIPDFKLPTLADTTKNYTNTTFSGKVFLIDFWGTWCGPCIEQMPYLHKAYKEYHDKGFSILSVAMNDNYKSVKKFRDHKWPMPWYNSFISTGSKLENRTKSKFNIDGYPTGILVNSKGEIIAAQLEVQGEQLMKTLQQYFQ